MKCEAIRTERIEGRSDPVAVIPDFFKVDWHCGNDAGIADRAGQRCRTVLVDGHDWIERHRRRHVVNLHGFGVHAHARIVVGHRGADCVEIAGRTRRIVVQILMRQCERLTARCAGAEGVLFDVARRERIAPVHVRGKCVQRTRIADRAGQCGDAVLVDRHDRIQHQRRGRVVDRNGSLIVGETVVLVENATVDGVAAVVLEGETGRCHRSPSGVGIGQTSHCGGKAVAEPGGDVHGRRVDDVAKADGCRTAFGDRSVVNQRCDGGDVGYGNRSRDRRDGLVDDLPQFGPAGAVVRRKEECVTDGGEVGGEGVTGRVDVLHEHRVRVRAI